jgi:Flp pilus assembly protein TadD
MASQVKSTPTSSAPGTSRLAVGAAFAFVALGLGYLSIWRPLVDPPARTKNAPAVAAPDLQRGYGLVSGAGGRREPLTEAAQIFARAAELEPQNAEPWFGWGWSLQLLGDQRGAEAKYLRAAALAFDNPKVADTAYFTAYNLGVLYTDERRVPEALGALERASTFRPNEPAVWARMGRLFLELGAGARAVASLEKAVALGDSSVTADLTRARALVR